MLLKLLLFINQEKISKKNNVETEGKGNLKINGKLLSMRSRVEFKLKKRSLKLISLYMVWVKIANKKESLELKKKSKTFWVSINIAKGITTIIKKPVISTSKILEVKSKINEDKLRGLFAS